MRVLALAIKLACDELASGRRDAMLAEASRAPNALYADGLCANSARCRRAVAAAHSMSTPPASSWRGRRQWSCSNVWTTHCETVTRFMRSFVASDGATISAARARSRQ